MAGINILDIIVVCLTILLLLIGIWRGMYKIIYGFISSIVALVLAIVFTSTVVTFTVKNTQIDDRLVDYIAQPISSYVPNAQTVVAFYDLDEDEETSDQLGFQGGTEIKPFSEILAGTKLSFLSGSIESIIGKQLLTDEDGQAPFIDVLVAYLTSYILAITAFIILWILSFILMKIICAILKKLSTSTFIGYFLNKVIGGVLGLAIAGVFIFGILTVIQAMGNYEVIIPANNLIEDSIITKFLSNNNFVYTFVSKSFNMQAVIDKIMEAMSKVGI